VIVFPRPHRYDGIWNARHALGEVPRSLHGGVQKMREKSPLYDSVEPPPVVKRSAPVPPPIVENRHDRSLFELSAEDDSRRTQIETTFWLFTAIPSGMLSALVHLLLLIGLGICFVASQLGGDTISIELVQSDELLAEEPLEISTEIELAPDWLGADDSQLLPDDAFESIEPLALIDPDTALATIEGETEAAVSFTTGKGSGGAGLGGGLGGDLASRGRRRQFSLAHGATEASEDAVELALAWIVSHQRKNGSWSFNHREGVHLCERCRCGQPGNHIGAINGATAMGLLPLLGAGHSHLLGQYREQVSRGLQFLIYRQGPDGSFMDQGNMYSHGLVTLALCEALAMTRLQYTSSAMTSPRDELPSSAPDSTPEFQDDIASDPFSSFGQAGNEQQHRVGVESTIEFDELEAAAQRAIWFIERAQHAGGGWRYRPGQRGDTSVVGWQMMALKSGYLAELSLHPDTLTKAVSFLDAAAEDRIGSCYGYLRGNGAAQVPMHQSIGATTPIGLLCRMYTGWEHDREGITVGVERLERWARPKQGLYYYYYATQVMHHYGGIPWQKWNHWMRDYLVKKQSRQGSEAGSWILDGPHDTAGRLYCTSMAAMTLEIYYRYVPIYSEEAVEVASSTRRGNE